MADLGWLSGLGAGLGSGSQRFINTQLAKQQMALYQQQEARRMEGEMRAEQQWKEQKRIQRMEETMMEAKEQERLLEQQKLQAYADRVRPQLNEMMDREFPEEMFPEDIINLWKRALTQRSSGVKDKIYPSLIMTFEDAQNMVDKYAYTHDAPDGKKYQAYPQYAIDLAKQWGISTTGMKTKEMINADLKKEFPEIEVEEEKPPLTLWQKTWQKVFGGGETPTEAIGPPEQIGNIENPQWREVFNKAVNEGWSTEKIRQLYKEFQATYGQ